MELFTHLIRSFATVYLLTAAIPAATLTAALIAALSTALTATLIAALSATLTALTTASITREGPALARFLFSCGTCCGSLLGCCGCGNCDLFGALFPKQVRNGFAATCCFGIGGA
jgi:hypothetical protein